MVLRLQLVVALVLVLAPFARAQGVEQPAAPKVRMLVLEVRGVDVEKQQIDMLTAFITAHAARFEALNVVSAADLRDLADLQADKMRAGCDEDSAACLAELAGALDAQLVLTSRAGKLESVYVVTISVFDAKSGAAVARTSVEAWSLGDIPQKLGPALDDVLGKATGTKPRAEVASQEKNKRERLDPSVINAMRIGGGVGAVVGAVAFTLGAIPGFIYHQKKNELIIMTAEFRGDSAEIEKAQRIRQEGLDARDLYNAVGQWGVLGGVALVVVGGVAMAGSFYVSQGGE